MEFFYPYFSSSNYSSSSIRWFFGYACMSAPMGALQTLFTFSSLQTRLKWKIEQLKTFTKYAIILQAFNARGAGPKSEEVVVTTMEDGKLRASFKSTKLSTARGLKNR